mmetsp:Transcript_12644/g.23700  ORF Transcript_12644/g.23700 Transcript_12644/m.23700 type:complete len:434 (+) Transcript_12644:150-1451(+)|eukprot:CAMPEP_0176482296 /NCGR_PEP_ID=MMETSP0200_2-20121128/3297_1 /TAXON_ID=947934 /ORGANISM="Chaetoceros sp., Strain GSL56" /LENGTH=433 /DNA_ID=CAMNT_0017878597 /DNA_START=58 /DNA_END=1359 /DNA_ORIENTATION=+
MRLPTNDDSFDDNDDTGALVDQHDQLHKTKPNPIVNCIFTFIAYIQFFWIHHRTEVILGLILVACITLAVTGAIEVYEHRHETGNKHTVRYDYSNIQSALELKLGNVDHWCLDGTDKHCPTCDDPTNGVPRLETTWWRKVFTRNVMLSRNYMNTHDDIDVIFLGDSNIEARVGTLKGLDGSLTEQKNKEGNVKRGQLEDTLSRSRKKFEKYFDKRSGSQINGLALGIAGDTSPNLLWRIQNNEMSNLKPKVWWINIGLNDLLYSNCSEEITIMGVLRIVEELLVRNNNYMDDVSTIVINSILPVGTRTSLSLEGPHIRNRYWPAIKMVNERLAKFAKKHKGVRFFDVTDMMTESRGRNRYMKREFFIDMVHLSAEGQEELAKAQVDFLSSLLQSNVGQNDNFDSYYLDPTDDKVDMSNGTQSDSYYAGEDDWF